MKTKKPARHQLIPMISAASRLGGVTVDITKRHGHKKSNGKHWALHCGELWDGPMYITKEQVFAIFDLALKKKLGAWETNNTQWNKDRGYSMPRIKEWARGDVCSFFNLPICDEWHDLGGRSR